MISMVCVLHILTLEEKGKKKSERFSFWVI